MTRPFSMRLFSFASIIVSVAVLIGYRESGESGDPQSFSSHPRWWRGNLHTHTMWSDGDDFPEMIVAWYKEHDYHFLALSDHNVLSVGERWVETDKFAPKRSFVEATAKYRDRFGSWVEEKELDGKKLVRLKPLDEFRALFDEPGRFLLIQSVEITDKFQKLPVHLNATNVRDLILPQGGTNVVEVLQKNVDAVLEQRRRTGQAMIAHVNHPNFHWGVSAQDLARVRGERFFEVYNGHPSTYNHGDSSHPSTEWIWDYVLATRLSQPDGETMYGLAVDDAHHYHQFQTTRVNPGRGWIMVRARHLTPEAIINAMEQGDFYASTGVRLLDVVRTGSGLSLEIVPEPGVTYLTQFVGTLKSDEKIDGQDETSEIGRVLAETSELKASYTFTGQELYVRARVRSSKPHPNPCAQGDMESAWTQAALPE